MKIIENEKSTGETQHEFDNIDIQITVPKWLLKNLRNDLRSPGAEYVDPYLDGHIVNIIEAWHEVEITVSKVNAAT